MRQLPEQTERVETGPVKFGDDWTGVFIRGDNALWYCMAVAGAIQQFDRHGINDPNVTMGLGRLMEILGSCDERKPGSASK